MKQERLQDRRWYAFHDRYWSRNCYSNVKLDSVLTRSVEDAIAHVCCFLEDADDAHDLASMCLFVNDGIMEIKADRKGEFAVARLAACPKCGGYVYGDAKNGPLHPLNDCEDVMVEKVMES